MIKVLEAVPNFSEGRDDEAVQALVATIAGHDVDVLDWSSDPDHHRSVVTLIGAPEDVIRASVAGAEFALQHFDLRDHTGIHPRVGTLDVLPFVPFEDATMEDAIAAAREAGRRIHALGVPVYFYGRASEDGARGLAELRRGGFESLSNGFPPGREPDLSIPSGKPHPSAGVTCVGARPLLLAWNVFVEGISLTHARDVARTIRERDGGFPGVRALGLELPRQRRLQISMNHEDVERTSPLDVFAKIEREVGHLGGRIVETQVIGMIPDALVLPGVGDRLHLPDLDPARLLSRRIDGHIRDRSDRGAQTSDNA